MPSMDEHISLLTVVICRTGHCLENPANVITSKLIKPENPTHIYFQGSYLSAVYWALIPLGIKNASFSLRAKDSPSICRVPFPLKTIWRKLVSRISGPLLCKGEHCWIPQYESEISMRDFRTSPKPANLADLISKLVSFMLIFFAFLPAVSPSTSIPSNFL